MFKTIKFKYNLILSKQASKQASKYLFHKKHIMNNYQQTTYNHDDYDTADAMHVRDR
jgi:hypothetical protein